jgi:membrane protease YdiL (CAAX protease family)
MKPASVRLRLAAILCLAAVVFLVTSIIVTDSHRELKEEILEDPLTYAVMFLVALPVSVYVVFTNRHPRWAYRLLGRKAEEITFAKDRKELILKVSLLIVLAIEIGIVILCIGRYLAS